MTGKSAQDDVIKILEEVGQPLATGALVDELSEAYAESTVRNAVSKLNGEGRVEKVSHGVYRLSSGTGETVEIPLVSIRANAGEGEEPFEEQVDGYVVFDREAIQRETNADPSSLAMISVTGDSMVPTLTPGDRMLVVRHQKGEPLVSGGIYILRSSLRGIIVKRLRWTDDETIILESDNENGPTIEVDMSDDGGHNWEVLGRVVRVQKHL